MKIELTIKIDYLPDWGLQEGLRELIQNARDAEIEFGSKMEIRHRRGGDSGVASGSRGGDGGDGSGVLVIENEGVSLPHEALLFGHTTKIGRTDTLGKFGEGLKLGTLALVRAGHMVRIRSGGEVWTPEIARSEKFDAQVLTFVIQKGRQEKKRVQIEVSGISEDVYGGLAGRFLFLRPATPETMVQTSYGSLLLDPMMVGKLFVKGIYIQSAPGLRYGYDLTRDVSVDRDRRIVYSWDLDWRLREIWRAATEKRTDLIEHFSDLLDEDAADVKAIDDESAAKFSENVRDYVANVFRGRHGKDAVAVPTLADGTDLEHLGRKGVVASGKAQLAMLESVIGKADRVKDELRHEVVRRFSWGDLSDGDRATWTWASIALELAISVSDAGSLVMEIVEFRSPSLLGQFNGQILLSKKVLTDKYLTLRVMIHEYAHKFGTDGEKSHVSAIESIWEKIARQKGL